MRRALHVLLVAALALVGCGKKPATRVSGQAIPVDMATVEQRDVPIDILAVGSVEPVVSVRLKAKVGGEVQEVLFADGATVAAGDVLMKIDPRTYEAAARRAEANLTIAQAQAKNAEDQLARYSTLSTQGSASAEQFSQFTATAKQQRAQVIAREADAAEAKLSLDWATVRSPISGRAGAALVKAGNIVQAESEVLTVINQLQPIYVTFAVPESSLDDVRRRLAEGEMVAEARDPESGKTLQQGRVVFVDNAVNLESGTIILKATFPNAEESLWPGQFVDVRVALDEAKGALVIPTEAILESQSGPRVFVVKDGVAGLRDIQVIRTYGASSLVGSGLTVGERVVTNGQLRLTDGAKVKTSGGADDRKNSEIKMDAKAEKSPGKS